MRKITFLHALKVIVIIILFVVAFRDRLMLFSQFGKDIDAHKKAVEDLLDGKNPYIWTIESFNNPDDPGDHGFAYLPGLLYIETFLVMVHFATNVPIEYLFKIPVLATDIGVGLIFIKLLYRKDFLVLLTSLVLWFFNPYFLYKQSYVYFDTLPIFFMFLSLYFLEKDDVLAGSLYAISIALKTFPILLLPIFLIKSKDKVKFITAGALIGIAISLPFCKSLQDFWIYITGALLIHSERFVQGRPFLYYISYYYKVEFFRTISFKTYTFLASFGGWIVIGLIETFSKLFNKFKLMDKFSLSIIPFIIFYIFTPVLNRTYLMWIIPILIVGVFNIVEKTKYKYVFYVTIFIYFEFYYWYLTQWKDGFHIWHP